MSTTYLTIVIKKKNSPTCGTKIAASLVNKSKCIMGHRSLNNLNNINSAYKHKTDFNIKNNVSIKFVIKTAMLLISDRPKGNYKRGVLRKILIILIIKE